MPAPTPIQIRYGMDPTAVGGLALATGTARRQYADYQNQLASDRSFLRDDLNRRTADNRYRNNFNLSLLGMQANERMARDQATALQEASGLPQRQAAQRGGVSAPIARAGQPVDLVPETGPIDGGPQGGGSVTFREEGAEGPGDTFYSTQGKIVQHGGDVPLEQQGGYVRAGQQQRMIPADRRSALEEVKLAQSWMPPVTWNALWAAVQGGALDPSHVSRAINSIRADSGDSSGLSAAERESNTTAAGSPPCWWAITSTPARSPHCLSCPAPYVVGPCHPLPHIRIKPLPLGSAG
ncbi:hypothetical protein LCGC14_2591690 [marine sediment metagenome]|uniref:Uncharacterized protein n=1 Tax=marine sediment metagenome TaxID=412755 RepID=A0A0F9AZD0_9ZZZZ